MNRKFAVSLCCVVLLIVSAPSLARSRRPQIIQLDESSIKEVLDQQGKTVICGLVQDKWIPGTVRKTTLFSSLVSQLVTLQKNARKASGKKKKVLLNRIKVLRVKIKNENTVCANLVITPTVSPVPTTEATPIIVVSTTPTLAPSPTATPITCQSYFEGANKSVTSCGKERFGIPLNISANVSSGDKLYKDLCQVCHQVGSLFPGAEPEEGNTLKMSELKAALENFSIMVGVKNTPNQDLAHLVAYLRRSETP
jgi:hypothetical protein